MKIAGRTGIAKLRYCVFLCAWAGLIAGCKELEQFTPNDTQGPPPTTAEISSSHIATLPPDPQLAALAKGPLGGITIIDVTPLRHHASPIVLYLSPEGSYVSGFPNLPNNYCIGWLTDAQDGPSSLVFGIDDPSVKRLNTNLFPRPICDRFTIKYEDQETVRFIQGNWNRKLKILARVPLMTSDWSLEPFKRYLLKGIGLGPVELDAKDNTSGGTSFNVASLDRGYLKQYQKRLDSNHAINGRVAAREVTGWPSDALVLMWAGIKLPQTSSVAAFNEAVREKYGEASVISGAIAYYIHDLQGRLLHEQEASPQNCMPTFESWKDRLTGGLMPHEEVGPWGCSIVMRHSIGSGMMGQVAIRDYSMELAAGLAWGQGHFKARLLEAKRYKEAVAANQPVKPQL